MRAFIRSEPVEWPFFLPAKVQVEGQGFDKLSSDGGG